MFKKSYLLLLTLGLALGLSSPLVDAVGFGGGPVKDSAGTPILGAWSSAEYSNEDNVDVPEIHSEHDEEELTINYCAGVEHLYYYYNDSENTADQEFRAPIYAFAIVLDSDYPGGTPATEDFWTNIDTKGMVCTDGAGTYLDCSFDKSTVSDGDLLATSTAKNGTEITFETLDWVSGSPRGIVWRYNTDTPDEIENYPWLDAGEFESEGIIFEPEDYSKPIQTATTESWAKVEYFSVDPDDRGDIGAYENVYPIEVDTDKDGTDDVGVDPDDDYIFWYGLNGRLRTIWTPCEGAGPTCATLSIDPSSLTVSDIFSDTEFTLTATNSNGDDITNDIEVTYEAFQYDGSAATGDIRYRGALNLSNGNAGPVASNDTEIEYRNSLPGDRITAYVSDYDGVDYQGTGICEVEVEFPYCSDLNITDPSSFAFISSGDVDMPVEIEAEASTGEDWPYSVTYNSTDTDSTFDGNTQPYTTTDWTVASYQSDEGASVWVEAEDDVAGLCSDYFSYAVELTCEELEIIIPSNETLTCEEMSVEDVEIRWESFMSSGAPSTGPWIVTSTNPAGTFAFTPGGPTVGTGSVLVSSPPMVVYYTGEDGDAIQVMDTTDPTCIDSLDSETCEDVAPVCEDFALGTPYITNDDGSTTSIDLTDDADLETLYGETTVCWDYSLNTSDAAYTARLIANGFTDSTRTANTGNLTMTMNETAGSSTGNPSNLAFTGFTSYTGTICWENYEAGNELSVFVLGDRPACNDEEILPPPPEEEAPVCVDLQMSPDSYTMAATDVDAGNIPVIITVQGEDATWTGTLIVEHTGTGALFYSDGSPSTAGDGHLEIPVSGSTMNVTVFYRNGHAGDVVSSYISGDETLCSDVFTITQPAPGLICEDLELSPDSVEMEADDVDAGTINGSVVVQGSDSTWTGTLIITKSGSGQLHYSDGSNSGYSDGRLEIAVSGVSSTVTFTYTGGQADDIVRAYIQNDALICSDQFSITQPTPEVPFCTEIEFPEEIQTYNCEDVPEVELCLDSNGEDEREIEICYEARDSDDEKYDGEWEYDGVTYEGCEEIIVAFEDGETRNCIDITFNEVCEDSEITVSEAGKVCEELDTEEVEVGTFEKFIYTFNFASEKNSYTDEGVFFSHDEDRAFYTLEYNPAGEEEAITFTDAMWGSELELEGTKGDGSDSGGNVRLATTYEELVKSKFNGAYDEYNLITNMGFGCETPAKCREEDSQSIANYVGSDAFKNNYESFVAYVKYPVGLNQESVLIEECEYDKDDDLESEGVCYNPNFLPEKDGEVVIENAGTVQDDYGDDATIRIRYVGVINSGLNCGDNADECLTEEFENTASVEAFESAVLTDSAKLVVLCSYLMTQNAGDVYLEVALQGGSDIACIFVDEDDATSSDYRNVDSLIILQEGDNNQNDTADEYMSSYSTSTVSFCDDDEDNLIGNLSSYVCEIVAKVTDLWAKTSVESTTSDHLSQATRNADTSQAPGDSTYTSWSELTAALTNSNNRDSNILYFDASQSNDGKMTLGKLEVPAGAWTVIVKGGDLVLTGDISYAKTQNISDYKNLPSIAFVVQDGDIYIDDSAQKLVGVYYTDQKFDGDERSAVDEQLTVEGSFYGNIQTLIERAKYVGPPTIDGGGIVIKYDSRIILNTPPALSDYVNINTEKGVN
ncbi:MAG: hypothetical protein AAB383_00420 [Patescibacteria group bacterium]